MKIYTTTGDSGSTSLAMGGRVAKCHPRVEAYGEVDELIAHLGLLSVLIPIESQKTAIKRIQSLLMQCCALLAGSSNDGCNINSGDINWVENLIDSLQKDLPPLRSFVISGGNEAASHCHITRCVCRRAERRCVAINDTSAPHANILRLLNRLSDYLFVLARTLYLQSSAEEPVWENANSV